MIDVNSFPGKTDSDILDNAFQNIGSDGVVVIPPRCQAVEPERTWWCIDRAICIPANTTVVLRNCRIKLSDRCRDNFFRSANCGFGFPDPQPISHIHIRGEGSCILEGADHPRATGDGSKILACPCPYDPADLAAIAPWVEPERRSPEALSFWDRHSHSYGTDCGKEDQSQYGDWRGVGILFANVHHFSVENLTVVRSHGWGLSFEACSFGTIRNITFEACMYGHIDGMRHNMENQDGIDLRNGCHHILITDIFGQTGDDVIALTAYKPATPLPGGSLCTTHVMHTDYTRREADIHDIVIRNVVAESHLCYLVRILPGDTHIRNVVIDGIVDTSKEPGRNFGTFVFGTRGNYGNSNPGELRNITVSNVVSTGKKVFDVLGYWSDSTVCNVINKNPDAPMFYCFRPDGMTQVQTLNLHTTETP